MSGPLQLEELREGGVVRLILDRPPANLLDMEMVQAIQQALPGLAARSGLRLLIFDSAGDHFCFGASVPEHLPGQVDQMLPAFHQLFRDLEATGIPTAAAVRGRCLGGGAELATWCGTVHCSHTARFAVPEVQLGVFPPVAAFALRWRISGARAASMVLTGRAVTGVEAASIGLADACHEDPLASLLSMYDRELAARSPAALRFAWKAARAPLARALAEELPALERLYLDELMAHPDAIEGLQAFVDKRPPAWRSA